MDGRNDKGQFMKGRKGALEDLTGRRFGRLVVVSRSENASGRTVWNCKCDCGNKKKVHAVNLKKGRTKSCGCWHDKYSGTGSKTHGMSKTRLYRVYRMMISRCYCPNTSKYKDYGGRGITVCKEWLDDFMNFYNWAMENGYDENAKFSKCTLDRKDVNGNYEPNNCRWITNKEQGNNRRNNHYVEINGETKTIREWCESRIYEASETTVHKRIRNGWSDIEAITKPVQKQFRRTKKAD